MGAFLQDYGLWIALGGVFVAMQWFGMGCCGGHRNRREDGRVGHSSDEAGKADGTAGAVPKSTGRCH
jgi:hypothetical protein